MNEKNERKFSHELYQRELNSILHCDPSATEDDIENLIEIDEWDLLIIFKNGKRYVYDRLTGFHRGVPYTDELTDEQEKREFARNFRKILYRSWITQEELAERIGTSQTMLSHYANGKCIPNSLILRKIAKELNCSMDDFFYKDIWHEN